MISLRPVKADGDGSQGAKCAAIVWGSDGKRRGRLAWHASASHPEASLRTMRLSSQEMDGNSPPFFHPLLYHRRIVLRILLFERSNKEEEL